MYGTQEKTDWLVCKECGRRATLMVHFTGRGSTAALRTVSELQSPCEIMHTIP